MHAYRGQVEAEQRLEALTLHLTQATAHAGHTVWR